MKRRRLITGGIVTGLGVFAGCIGGSLPGGGSGESAPGDVPVPSGFEKESTLPTPEEGVTIVRYTGTGSSADAVAAFKGSAKDAGWSEVGSIEVLGGKWSGAGFEKNDEVLVIHAEESGDEVTVTVVKAPKEMAGSEVKTETTETTDEPGDGESPPESDVEGSDIDDVPRFPDSVRTDYARNETDSEIQILIEYIAEATVEAVGDFYEEALPDNGWSIQQKVETDEGHGIVATKGSKQVEMYWEASSDYEGSIEIGVYVLEPK